jgi:hypothetical protein
MRSILEYFRTNVDRRVFDYPDDKKPRFNKQGEPYLWWRVYELIMNDGPMSKQEVLKKLGLKETSYSSAFAEYSKMNIIVPNKKTKKLEAIPPSEWKLNKKVSKVSFHTRIEYTK